MIHIQVRVQHGPNPFSSLVQKAIDVHSPHTLGYCSISVLTFIPNGHENTFFHGDLKQEVYMCIPLGLTITSENSVCQLRQSLYGSSKLQLHGLRKFTIFSFKPNFNKANMIYLCSIIAPSMASLSYTST